MFRCITFLACLFFTCLADAARDERIQVAIEEPASGESYSNGASRDAVTKALARLVEAGKLILKDAGKGKSKTYHLPGAQDAPKIISSNTDTEEADY